MGLSEEQFARWAQLPDQSAAAGTYEQIRRVLESPSSKIRGRSTEIYLQGSYANHTNTRVDSDVDIVVELSSTFQPGLSRLSTAEQKAFSEAYSDASYGWDQFREDVVQTLLSGFGPSSVGAGKKCINVSTSYLQADVVPALEFRDYRSFSVLKKTDYYEGISFFSVPDHDRVINYPKEHRRNGERKNGRTSDRYKPAVRVFKNARRNAVKQGLLEKGDAPSYFLECLIYNASDSAFSGSHGGLYFSVLSDLLESDLPSCRCGNEVTLLFGSEDTQWNLDAAIRTMRALIEVAK